MDSTNTNSNIDHNIDNMTQPAKFGFAVENQEEQKDIEPHLAPEKKETEEKDSDQGNDDEVDDEEGKIA